MFNPAIYDFLTELSANNYKEWFHENKSQYLACRENYIHNLELVIHSVSQFDTSITGLEPKDCIFRINRDIRFSKDKSPYKTNFGAFIAPGGRNKGHAGYYLHMEPGNSFLAGGIYMPQAPVLKAIRQEIFDNFEEFSAIILNKDFKAHFKSIEAEKLKTKPKGFPGDFEGLEYLKYKHYTVIKNIADNDFVKSDFPDTVKKVFGVLHPLNRFLNYAIDSI